MHKVGLTYREYPPSRFELMQDNTRLFSVYGVDSLAIGKTPGLTSVTPALSSEGRVDLPREIYHSLCQPNLPQLLVLFFA